MKFYDVSRPLNAETAVYKNYDIKRVRIETLATHDEDRYHESNLHMNLHTGTHVDAPLHMVAGGGSLETMPVDHYIGRCKVLDLSAVEDQIHASDLEGYAIEAGDIVIMRTQNSFDEGFNFDFVALAPDGAQWLVDRGVRTVGLDAMSIERGNPGHETHKILLGNGVAIIEDLRLAEISEGEWFISCLPLALTGVEGAPARAVMWRADDGDEGALGLTDTDDSLRDI